MGLGDSVNIDVLPLDYSILDDIVYKYPAGDNYFAYISRGCTNKCSFCAVPILGPEFCMTNNIVQQGKTIGEEFGEKKNLLCMNNITKNRLIDSSWKEQRKINTDAETIYKQLREKEE